MGFLDKAKDTISRRMNRSGEELVRHMDYDEPTEEEIEDEEEEDDEVESSAFEIPKESKSFFKKKQKEWEDSVDTSVKVPTPRDGKVQDVLDVLGIPATFEIDPDILMVDDLKDIEFDVTVPQGYDVSQVQSFRERTKDTVKFYLKLLSLRNEHVIKLATTVDRLQVDANNARWESQIANGINIMPTDDSEQLEIDNTELRLLVKRQQETIERLEESDGMTETERERYDVMRDEVSRLERENLELVEERDSLKTQVQYLEESMDDMDVSAGPKEWEEELPQAHPEVLQDSLPYELPELGEYTPPESTPSILENSAFEVDEDEDDNFMVQDSYAPSPTENFSHIELLGDDGSFTEREFENSSKDDEDDELEKLMKDWGQS